MRSIHWVAKFQNFKKSTEFNLFIQNHKISSISLEFKSPRPQSMMIEKYYKGQWMPFQYFSSNCYLTFGRTESDSAFDLESEALCTSKHSKITPLTNGVVIFSTLRGRPSSNNYENSQILRDFTTAEKLRFTLVRHGFNIFHEIGKF